MSLFQHMMSFLVHEDPVEIFPSSPKFLHGQPASSGDGSEGIWACMAGSIGGHDSGVDLLEVPIWLLYPPPFKGGRWGGVKTEIFHFRGVSPPPHLEIFHLPKVKYFS